VHQEVAYGDSQCSLFAPGVCTPHYSQIPVGGGVCGPRAFFSRFARKSFGLPTWGMTEQGHAAMSSWSPEQGWHIELGSAWQYGWWGPQSGVDFFLEVQARETRPNFQSVLRGGWVAKARGETPVATDWTPSNPKAYGKGGVWGALMLYAKKIAVNATTPLPPRVIGPSVVPTKVDALIAAWPAKWPTPNITTDSNGTITIPGAAYDYANRSAPVSAMKSFDLLGEQVVILDGACAFQKIPGETFPSVRARVCAMLTTLTIPPTYPPTQAIIWTLKQPPLAFQCPPKMRAPAT